jgi:DNA-3-methyladenine glycosylase I
MEHTVDVNQTASWLQRSADGRVRCSWCGDHPLYVHYHDQEWAKPVTGDVRLFEKLCLEGFQAGLSWFTILNKRDNFRAAFDGFEPAVVAGYGPAEVERLVSNAGIVRHRGKIESTINNAGRAIDLIAEAGSIYEFVVQFRPDRRAGLPDHQPLPPLTPESTALSKALKRRGWTFVGPTTVYAFMQAMGLVNDHIDGCEFL